MPFPPFDAPPDEHSLSLAFTGSRIVSAAEYRTDGAVEQALADGRARLMLMRGGRILLRLGSFDPLYTLAEAAALKAKLDHAVLLGHDGRGPLLAAPAGLDPEELPADVKAIDYRSVYVQGLLDPAALGALAQGAALLAWHSTHRFCGRCGNKTIMRAGGYKRACENCPAEHFPRTDPVAIMLAVTADKCLMGRSPHFQPGMYSCLAGFIEPGETIEAAVRRETFEESGIRIGRVAYFASQPWPFPYSLMIGCFGEALSDDIRRDASELEDCRWFSRTDVRAILDGNGNGVTVPPRGAIASGLIRAWAAEAA